MNRREMLKATGVGLAGLSILGPTAMATEEKSKAKPGKKKILVVGAHPDDPETGCGGTIARLISEGNEVVVVYMTRGERGIKGVGLDEAAKIRTAEALEACKVFGCRSIFLTQIDSAAEITPERYTEMINLMKQEKPDVVLSHWPLDGHRDHAICGILVLDAWRRVGSTFDLFFYEVMLGTQSKDFIPTDFVDITDFRDIKLKASRCHKSQDVDDWYDEYHTPMEVLRGMQYGCKYAEAFKRLEQSPTRNL